MWCDRVEIASEYAFHHFIICLRCENSRQKGWRKACSGLAGRCETEPSLLASPMCGMCHHLSFLLGDLSAKIGPTDAMRS